MAYALVIVVPTLFWRKGWRHSCFYRHKLKLDRGLTETAWVFKVLFASIVGPSKLWSLNFV